jgi:hypothetical protein
MKTKSFKTMAGALALASAGWLASTSMQAQPMYDRIHVNLPYTITLQNKTLQPGDYTIQQLPSTGGSSRVLLFYTNDGMKFETSAMTIPALDINTARDTKLVLNHVGDSYYISKIWVQGKDYGYELPVPDSIRERQREGMTETTVAATYTPSSTTDMTTTTASTSTTTAQSNNTADTTNQPVTTPATTDTAQNTQPVTQQPATTTTTDTSASANANNSADRAMADQTPTTPAPSTTASDNTTSSANRSSMPNTAAGWLTMLLSGSALSGAGLMLRRKR